jgi:hypothetical protein
LPTEYKILKCKVCCKLKEKLNKWTNKERQKEELEERRWIECSDRDNLNTIPSW